VASWFTTTCESPPTAPNVPPLRSGSPLVGRFTGVEVGLVSNCVATGGISGSEETVRTGPGNGSVLLAAEISSTWSSSARVSSGRVVIVRVRFLVLERRVRLAPLLLMVLASEFEREDPENLEEEGSCMDPVAGSFVLLHRQLEAPKCHRDNQQKRKLT
jgi:hypothetical protein